MGRMRRPPAPEDPIPWKAWMARSARLGRARRLRHPSIRLGAARIRRQRGANAPLPQARHRARHRRGSRCSGLSGSRLDRLTDGSAEAGFLMGTGVAVQHATLDGLVDLAEGGADAGLHGGLGLVARLLGVGRAGGEAPLDQGSHRRLVGTVLKTVALGDLDALLRRLVIGHRRSSAESANEDPTLCRVRASDAGL